MKISSIYLAVSLLSCISKKEQPVKEFESLVALELADAEKKEHIISHDTISKWKDDQSFLEEKLILSGKVRIKLPKSFSVMSEEMFNAKYPQRDRGKISVYTDAPGEINIAIEHTSNPTSPQELNNLRKTITRQFSNNPNIDLKKSEVKSINGKDFILVEFISQAVDTRVYNLMFISSLENKVMVGTFNCTIKHLPQWELICKEIVSSLKI